MIRVLIGAALALPLYFVLAPAARPLEAAAPAPCNNPLPQEPILVHDTTGFSLGGPIHIHFSLYANGLATLAHGPGPGLIGGDGKADFTSVTPAEAMGLLQDLIALGAYNQCDLDDQVSDLPLTTVTVFRGLTDARAHTFSFWWASTPQLLAIEDRIQTFIQTTFPNF